MGQDRIREYKVFTMELKKDDSLNEGEFLGQSSVFGNIDSWNDIVEIGAFKQTLRGNKVRPLFFMHTPLETVGIAKNSTNDYGLVTHGMYNMSVSKSVDTYNFHKQGAYGDLSIGYDPIKFEYETVKGVRVRLLKEIKLYEVSILPVGYAANPKAFVTELKSRDMFGNFSNEEILVYIKNKLVDSEFRDQLISLIEKPGIPPSKNKPIITKSGKPSRYFLEDLQNEIKKTKEVLNAQT